MDVEIAAGSRPVELYRRGGRGGTYVYDPAAIDWCGAGKDGVVQKVVRRDDERGRFLGLIGMEPMVRSGLHQHQGVATAYFLDGGLTDYQGPILAGQVGINLKGATHDAIAWQRTLMVARLEAPVTYPPEDGPLQGVPIAGCLGDQQAAMMGQRCAVHEAKNTYGTGKHVPACLPACLPACRCPVPDAGV